MYKYTEIHKPVLLQFPLLSDVVIDTALKMVKKRIENVAEIRDYIKALVSVKSINDEKRVVYGVYHMSFSTI